jgi:hypothetical protein
MKSGLVSVLTLILGIFIGFAERKPPILNPQFSIKAPGPFPVCGNCYYISQAATTATTIQCTTAWNPR